ncbi:MATE family efflux transporter [Clostridium estertheticum]|uniref:MATE family efflux transporter n=1 Tax=Clostridium estertheticum TaxID=238834 RepID=UPI001C7D4258|nr:MATE family efflux transporter [Clostridium estertheticum]MBX4259532.1 MATE family efflux transporter [Clostridium estertheticum]MCB2353835.1 MATE family efflux transporter [Clostridium estertheticum]WAG40466.1 MATE family efflux transporter [Clostridium estertheticum]WLC70826.1 MATE family efflux transporter [Clostridium estertheticum]
MKEKGNYYFEQATIPKAITHMAVPMMLGMSVIMIYNVIDAFFIGKLNNTAMMTAVTLALPFTIILSGIGNIFGVGGGTYISRLLGEGKLGEAKKVSSVTFFLSLLAGFIFMLFAIPLIHPIVQILGAKGDTVLFTKDFIMVLIIGGPFVIANFALGQVVRAEGASKVSMNGMFISVIVNIILDPILIFICHLNIVGAAIGTVVANTCALLYYVYYLKNKSSTLTVSIRTFKPTRSMLKDIFKIGISSFLLDAFMIISVLLLNNFSAYYGDYAVAAFGISQRIAQLAQFAAKGLYIGVIPLIAYAYAAKNIKRMKSIIKITAAYIAILTFAFSLIIFIFREPIVHLFSNNTYVINTGIYILIALLISALFASITGLFIGIFQGTGRGKEATIMSVVQGILLIPIMILGKYTFGLDGIIWSMTITEILTCIIGLYLWIRLKRDPSMKE